MYLKVELLRPHKYPLGEKPSKNDYRKLMDLILGLTGWDIVITLKEPND